MKHPFIRSVLSATFLLVLSFAATIEAQATVRRVPADCPTIQQAINASVNGDTVLVTPGTYVENFNFLGKAITVTSEAGPEHTIIDGNHNGSPVVTFNHGEGSGSVIRGFTIQHGQSSEGGGLFIRLASPTIVRNVITENFALSGGGMTITSGSPLVQSNTITRNRASSGIGGGGISINDLFAEGASPQILDNIISENTLVGAAGGGISIFGGSPLIRGNLIERNVGFSEGGGIWMVNSSNAVIVQNLIVGNDAATEFGGNRGGYGQGGGIYWSAPNDFSSPKFINNTIADNTGVDGSGFFLAGFKARTIIVGNLMIDGPGQVVFFCESSFDRNLPTFKFNNLFSPGGIAWGGDLPSQLGISGNISADPLFISPSVGDYHLRPGSPVVDAGDNDAPNLPPSDLDGKPRIQDGNGDGIAVVDMGVYEVIAPFDICIQDDSNGGTILRINSTTGSYQFTNCSGLTLSGTGSLIKRGGIITLQQFGVDRRVLATIDRSVNKGTASIQTQGMTFTITDRNTANDTCACTAH